MRNIIYIILLLSIGLNAQTYFCEGEKQPIEKMQVSVDSFRLLYESNYQCAKWDIQKQTSGNWGIYVSYIEVISLDLIGCSTIFPEIIGTVETSDGYYLIDSTTNEYDVLIKRVLGVPMIDANNNHLLINSIYDLDNFLTLPSFGNFCTKSVVYQYDGMLFVCVQSHNRTEHSPEIIPALFTMIQDIQGDECPEWEQPLATNGYQTGACVVYNDVEYTSLIDDNTWSPDGYPQGWFTSECLPYVSSTYNLGECIIYNGNTYESIIENNSWTPDSYPSGWALIE